MAIVAPRQRAVVVKDNNLYRYAEQQRKRKEELLKKVEEEEKAKMKVDICYITKSFLFIYNEN